MIARAVRYIVALATTVLVTACANQYIASEPVRIDYGTVQGIEIYRSADNSPVNVGTILGGVAGGVIGHQIGSGSGNTAATIVGAVGGAVAGHAIEQRVSGSRYRVTVQLDSGSTVVMEDSRDIDLRIGDRVRVENNRVERL